MIFCVSIFIFCLEPTVREPFQESTILELLDHSYVQSLFAIITRHFDNGISNDTLQLKILRTWITI